MAISPKGTMIGDSYFGFPFAFWFDIRTPPFANCIYLAILKQLHRAFSIGQFKKKIYANSVDHFHLMSLPPQLIETIDNELGLSSYKGYGKRSCLSRRIYRSL
jgi:hypothetical protein